MDNQLARKPTLGSVALAIGALALSIALTWPIYDGIANHFPGTAHGDTGWGFAWRGVWWLLGGFVTGAVVAAGALSCLSIVAMVRGEPAWALSYGLSMAVVMGSALVSGFWFPFIYWEEVEQRSTLLKQQEAEDAIRQQRDQRQEEARQRAEAIARQQRWDSATQRMAELEPGSVATTLAAAEAQDPHAVLDWLRDHFEPFLDSHPWRSLSDGDRAAFGAFARRAMVTMGSNGTDSETSVFLGKVLLEEHGLADTRGAQDECVRSKVATLACLQGVAALTLYQCRNGPSCLDGYQGMDFARLSKDIRGAANWECNVRTQMHDTELCTYVRGEKH